MQDFDFFLVLDFEATCDDSIRIHPQVMYKQAPKHNLKLKLKSFMHIKFCSYYSSVQSMQTLFS